MISISPLKTNKFNVSMIKFPDNLSHMLEISAGICLENIRLTKRGASLSIHSVTSEQMRHLNWKYRQISKATNILSISVDAVPHEISCYRELGDIFMCMPIIFQEAKKYQKDFHEYLIRILMHGILHLVGYDHETEDDYARMIDKERQLISLFDIKPSILTEN